MPSETASHKKLLQRWQAHWPAALTAWSPYTRLSEPNWLFTPSQESKNGLTGSFAAIRLNDNRILISLRQVEMFGLQDYGLEILAHEIGHHVYCPANLLEAGRSIAIATLALPTLEKSAPMIVNMWEDLLINDRLYRFHGHRHHEIYRRLNEGRKSESKLWSLYMRTFELLWGLEPGYLVKQELTGAEQGDAHLAARMVRVYGKDWLAGVGGFCSLCLPYLLKNEGSLKTLYRQLYDTQGMGEGCEAPMGILELGDFEIIHPSRDPNIAEGDLNAESGDEAETLSISDKLSEGGEGQNRQPHLFGQVLEALGLKLDTHDAAVKFYREKALPHLIPFPTQETEESTEPLMEGTEPWDVGHPADQVDWLQSIMFSPQVVPGVTTLRRTWGIMGGVDREQEPLDLDLYVDCSGSIPNPQIQFSFLALAGAIVVLSALRTGARVQATLWSGSGQFEMTPGFVRDENQILRVLTAYLGGGTAFPNHILRKTYKERKENERPVHILILSDSGIDTMNFDDELGNPGMEISQMALEKARGGGTMVLNLWSENFLKNEFSLVCKRMGWKMFAVKDWSGLISFAREFAKQKYGN